MSDFIHSLICFSLTMFTFNCVFIIGKVFAIG